jgi:uncharacterized protein (TIGR02271 family)
MHTDTSQIQPGWVVVDDLGEKIGDVYQVQPDYVLITKGLIFPKDLYIPLSAIQTVDTAETTVTLNLHKSGIDETAWSQAPAPGSFRGDMTDGSDDAVLTVKEEQVSATKARKQTGEVAVGKRVVEQQVDMDVPVTSEEVEVTRRRVDRPAHANETFAEDEGTIRVPVTSEEVSVTKEPRVVEEVVVSKRPVTESQRVSDTVRREEVVVDETGDARLRSDAATARRDAYARENTEPLGDDEDVAGQATGAAAGAVGGAAVGAAVGGPPGAVVGGVVGAAGGAAAGDAVEDEAEGDERR